MIIIKNTVIKLYAIYYYLNLKIVILYQTKYSLSPIFIVFVELVNIGFYHWAKTIL